MKCATPSAIPSQQMETSTIPSTLPLEADLVFSKDKNGHGSPLLEVWRTKYYRQFSWQKWKMVKEKKLPFKCTTDHSENKGSMRDQQQNNRNLKSSEAELSWPQTMLWLPCKTQSLPTQANRKKPQHKADQPKGTPTRSGPTSTKLASWKEGNSKETWNLLILTLAQGRR